MSEINNDSYNYYRNPQLQPAVVVVTTKLYLNRLLKLQTIGFLLLLSSIALQAVAIATNDWFVLNVNEYVQTAKGGLFYYCYLSNAGMVGKLDCFLYEKLPNFFVFANDRLFDSRVLLICSSGFLLIIMLIEITGIVCLRMSEKRGCDPFARLLRKKSRTFQILDDEYLGHKRPIQTSTPTLKGYKASMFAKQQSIDENFELNEDVNSKTTIERDTKKKQNEIKPIGYFAFLAISLLTMVGSVMEFVLKVSGFALFDSYITRLLAFNRVFMAYRSWSYWLMAGSILFNVIFWIFKVAATRYVVTLTRTVIKNDKQFSAFIGIPRADSESEIIRSNEQHSQHQQQIQKKQNVIRPDRFFSIQNNTPQSTFPNRYINVPQQIAPLQKVPITRIQPQTHKKSRQFITAIPQSIQISPQRFQQQSIVAPFVYDINIDNDELETSDSTITSRSIMNDTSMSSHRFQNFPSFPYIYRF